MINMEDKTNLGILVFRPNKEAKEVISIGPKNQAKGMLKYSAIIALGVEIKITNKNSDDINDFISFLLNGIAFDMYSINDC